MVCVSAQVTTAIKVADRSNRGKLRVSGEQRAWFLDQVLTQSFEDMRPGEARDAAMITVHGRMQGFLEVVATEEAFLCHFEPELLDTLPEEIGRYVFATRVNIEDVTEELGLVLLAGAGWEEPAKEVSDAVAVHPTRSFGVPAGYLWVTPTDLPAVMKRLEAEGLQRTSEEELEALRVVNGMPRWGREMDTKTFPQEAGIDARAVHYEKGCYLGQEAMAKIHFRGKVNRRLFRLRAEAALQEGADVVVDDQRIGRVTSTADGYGLALLRYSTEPGTEVRAGATVATVL